MHAELITYTSTAILTIGLLYLSWLDLKTKLLSTSVLFALSLAAMTILALGSPIGLSWKNALIGSFLNGFIFWLLRYIFSKIKQREAMGVGDIILVAVGGLWVGPWALPYIMALAGISSLLVLCIYYLIKKTKPDLDQEIPLGPGLCFGIYFSYLGVLLGFLRIPM